MIMNNKRRIIIIFFTVVFFVVLINLAITNIIIKRQIKTSSSVQFSVSSGGQAGEDGLGGEASISESAPQENLNIKEEKCLNEFYRLTGPLFGFKEDSKFSEWKEECFDKLSFLKEKEFLDFYGQYVSIVNKLGQCYPEKDLNQKMGRPSFEECNEMFKLHLGCEVYRKGDQGTYEKMKSLVGEFLEKIFVNSGASVPSSFSKLEGIYKTKEFSRSGECNVSVGEEFLKAKELFCRGVFSGVNFVEK